MDYLRVIRLGLGSGKPGAQACWMTALQAHMNGEWTDRCECVDPVINRLCILINDLYGISDTPRTEDIMNFGLFRVLGTAGTPEDADRRMFHLIDTAVRQWLPEYWQTQGLSARVVAARFRNLPKIEDIAGTRSASALLLTESIFLPGLTVVEQLLQKCPVHAQSALPFGTFGPGTTWRIVDVVRQCATIAALGTDHLISATGPINPLVHVHLMPILFKVLAEMVELGPHETKEMPEPACGIPEFHRLCGVKV